MAQSMRKRSTLEDVVEPRNFISVLSRLPEGVSQMAPRDVVVKCVEEELVRVLGPAGKDSTTYHLARRGVNLTDSFDRPAQFIKVVRMIFGTGSIFLGRSFVQRIG